MKLIKNVKLGGELVDIAAENGIVKEIGRPDAEV